MCYEVASGEPSCRRVLVLRTRSLVERDRDRRFGLFVRYLGGATQPASGGMRAVAASCVGLTARQRYRSARLVLDGRMLAGATAGAGDQRVLSSPARVAVTQYLKGHGPRTVRVQTAVTATPNGVTENSEGILPGVGQRWRIFTDRSPQPLLTSDCNGSRRLR